MEKTIDKKSIEGLAILIASKTGLDENPATVARKVIADYVGAKKILHEYNQAAEKAAKKQEKQPKEKKATDGKKQKKDVSKATRKTAKKASGE